MEEYHFSTLVLTVGGYKAFRLWMAMESRLHTLDTGMQDRIYSLVLKYAEKKDFPPGGVFAEGNDEFVIPK